MIHRTQARGANKVSASIQNKSDTGPIGRSGGRRQIQTTDPDAKRRLEQQSMTVRSRMKKLLK